jgi:hypothetical protein
MDGENRQAERYSSTAGAAGDEEVGLIGREWNDDAGGEGGSGEQVHGEYGSGNVSDPAPIHVRSSSGGGGQCERRSDRGVEVQHRQAGGENAGVEELDLFSTNPVSLEPLTVTAYQPLFSFSSAVDDYDYGPLSPVENCTACMDVEREREERERRFRMEREYSDLANFFNSQYSRYSHPSGFAQTRLYRRCFVCNRTHL